MYTRERERKERRMALVKVSRIDLGESPGWLWRARARVYVGIYLYRRGRLLFFVGGCRRDRVANFEVESQRAWA